MQMVSNLLTNAAKFSPVSAAARIEVRHDDVNGIVRAQNQGCANKLPVLCRRSSQMCDSDTKAARKSRIGYLPESLDNMVAGYGQKAPANVMACRLASRSPSRAVFCISPRKSDIGYGLIAAASLHFCHAYDPDLYILFILYAYREVCWAASEVNAPNRAGKAKVCVAPAIIAGSEVICRRRRSRRRAPFCCSPCCLCWRCPSSSLWA